MLFCFHFFVWYLSILIMRQSGFSSLPGFLQRFLEKKEIKYLRSPVEYSLVDEYQSHVANSLEKWDFFHTPYSIIRSYDIFKLFINQSQGFLQTEYKKLLFPLFLHFAKLLIDQGLKKDFNGFISKYRVDHEAYHQEKIEELLSLQSSFIMPKDTVFISKFADFELNIQLEKLGSPLLSIALQTWIKYHVSDNFQAKNLLKLANKDDMVNETQFNFEQVINPSNIPIDESNNESLSKYNQLPNIYQYTLYNHYDTVVSPTISKCGNMLLYGKGCHVDLESFQDTLSPFNVYSNRTLITHKGTVTCLALSPSSLYIGSGSVDCCIRIAIPSCRKQIIQYKYHIKPISDIAWNQGDRFIAASSFDKTVSMWCPSLPNMVRAFIGHQQAVLKVVFKGEDQIITGSIDSSIRIWSVGEGKCISKLSCEGLIPTSIDASNSLISIGYHNGSAIVWDTNKCTKIMETGSYTSPVSSLRITKDERYLICGFIDGCFKIIKIEGGEKEIKHSCCLSTIDTINFLKDGSLAFCGRSLRKTD